MSDVMFCAFLPAVQSPPGNPLIMFGPILLFGAILFFLFRAQSKENKRKQKMIENIQTGDKVVTVCGMHGIIANVKERTFILKIADNVKVEINKSGIATVLNKEDNNNE